MDNYNKLNNIYDKIILLSIKFLAYEMMFNVKV